MLLNVLVFNFSILLIYLILKLEEDKLQLLQTPAAIFKIGSKISTLKIQAYVKNSLEKSPRDLFSKKPAENFPQLKNPRDLKNPRALKKSHYIYKSKKFQLIKKIPPLNTYININN